LEVKATSGVLREHHFTSRQLPAHHGIQVWVASVLVAEVEVGMTIADLFEQLATGLPTDLVTKLSTVIARTVGLPPGALKAPEFDLESTLQGVRIFKGEAIPTPLLVPGSSNLSWTALLQEAEGEGVECLAELLPRMDSLH